jgi:hypothetical protein
MINKILIGIDPGFTNGFAVYDCETKQLTSVLGLKTYQVIFEIDRLTDSLFIKDLITVYIEDPTTWKPFKGIANQAHRMKGAGSVTARFHAILEYLEDNDIKHVRVPIQGNAKKMNAEMFKKVTGYNERTNEHGRDAALLIYGR